MRHQATGVAKRALTAMQRTFPRSRAGWQPIPKARTLLETFAALINFQRLYLEAPKFAIAGAYALWIFKVFGVWPSSPSFPLGSTLGGKCWYQDFIKTAVTDRQFANHPISFPFIICEIFLRYVLGEWTLLRAGLEDLEIFLRANGKHI